MTHLDLFVGAGGAAWFGKLIGARCVGYVENDEYCQKVIRARIKDGIFDDAPIFSDVRTFDGLPYRGRVDLLTAGFPCQPFSCAGKRQGEADERNMWPDTIRIVREVRPRVAMFENVAALATNRYFGTILYDIQAAGYELQRTPIIIGADEVGAPHRQRDRLWFLISDTASPGPQRRLRAQETRAALPIASGLSWWGAASPFPRVANGIPHRIAITRAAGNAWIPSMAYEFWQRMMADNEC